MTWDTCWVSVQVCILWRTRPLWSSKASPSETLLTSSAVVKCDGRAFGAFPGCVTRCFTLTSRFLPPRPVKVTIYGTRCRHFAAFWGAFARRCDVIGLQMWPTKVADPDLRHSHCVILVLDGLLVVAPRSLVRSGCWICMKLHVEETF